MSAVCACGHFAFEHEHYRAGTDCSHPGCDCTRLRPVGAR